MCLLRPGVLDQIMLAKSGNQPTISHHDDTKMSQQTVGVFHYVNTPLLFPPLCLVLVVFLTHSTEDMRERCKKMT